MHMRFELVLLLMGYALPCGLGAQSAGGGGTGGVTLGRSPFNGLKARVIAARFFESGANVPDQKDRVVTTTFDALTTRYVNLELELEYAKAAKPTEFEVRCRFDGPDGKPRTPSIKGKVEAGWVGSYHTMGWGLQERGLWPEGIYKVTCLEEGQQVVSAGFEVVKAAAAVQRLGASVTHLKFFQSLDELVPVETRQYSSRFDGRTTKWIKAEFGLVYPQVTAPIGFVVECAYVFPDGSVKNVRVQREIPAGWTGSVHSQGIGWPEAGHWPTGKYKISCWNNGEKMAEGGFEMYDGASPAAAVPGARVRFYGKKTGSAGDPAYVTSFEAGGFDTLYVEASMPVRLAGDSAAFGCTVTDPAGITSAFQLEGGIMEREKALVARGPIGVLEVPKMRGSYRVDCRTGRSAVIGRFEFTGQPDLPEQDAKVTATALYEGGDEPPGDEAVADVVFSSAKARSFWLVGLLDHPTDKGGAGFAYSCRVTGARNAVIAESGPQTVKVNAGERAIVLRTHLALAPKQKWVAGKYGLTCSAGATSFLKTGFDLTR